jgi:hypothetical protein
MGDLNTKTHLKLLPMMLLSPLGYFLGAYFQGMGTLTRGTGFLISAFCLFALPLIVATILSIIIKREGHVRAAIFIVALVLQYVLTALVPPAVTAEMIGITHRLKHKYEPGLLRECAAQIRQRKQMGNLVVGERGEFWDYFLTPETAKFVDESELPVMLRAKFKRVYIQPSYTGRKYTSDDDMVVFAFDTHTGILCSNQKRTDGYFTRSMADGVYAYRVERQ